MLVDVVMMLMCSYDNPVYVVFRDLVLGTSNHSLKLLKSTKLNEET